MMSYHLQVVHHDVTIPSVLTPTKQNTIITLCSLETNQQTILPACGSLCNQLVELDSSLQSEEQQLGIETLMGVLDQEVFCHQGRSHRAPHLT